MKCLIFLLGLELIVFKEIQDFFFFNSFSMPCSPCTQRNKCGVFNTFDLFVVLETGVRDHRSIARYCML